MPSSCLPNWPLILFGILEPAALIWAYIVGIQDPQRFFADQAPNHPLLAKAFTPQAEALTLQMVNLLLLLAPMALICCWTTTATTTKWYLFSVALADLGHIYGTYRGVGPEYFWDVKQWNDMVWGNVGVSLFLHINRWATLAGAFGTIVSGDERKVKGS